DLTKSFSVLANGNVGVGTITPSTKLDVVSSNGNFVRLVGDGSSIDKNWRITQSLTDGTFTTPINAFYTDHSNNARSTELFRIHSGETAAPSTAFRVTTGGTIIAPSINALTVASATGNVGVGTTSPGFLFHVENNLPTVLARIRNLSTSGSALDLVTAAS